MNYFTEVKFPQNPGLWFLSFIYLLAGAIFEEFLFRSFLCDTIIFNLQDFKYKKTAALVIEFSVVVLFAFCHKNNGSAAVINAFLSGIVLRLCYKKSRNIFVTVICHFIYNVLVFAGTYVIQFSGK